MSIRNRVFVGAITTLALGALLVGANTAFAQSFSSTLRSAGPSRFSRQAIHPAVQQRTFRSVTPVTVFRPVAPVTTFRPAAPITAFRPAAPVTAFRPATPVTVLRPTVIRTVF